MLRSRGIETWGPQGTRVRTSEANWRKLRREELATYGQSDGVYLCSAADERRLLEAFAADGVSAEEAGRVYLVDPLGNLLMTYPPGTDPRSLSKDLEKLLRLSRIG